jgi:hypothetical protein
VHAYSYKHGTNNILSPLQGFYTGHYCESQLIIIIHDTMR